MVWKPINYVISPKKSPTTTQIYVLVESVKELASEILQENKNKIVPIDELAPNLNQQQREYAVNFLINMERKCTTLHIEKENLTLIKFSENPISEAEMAHFMLSRFCEKLEQQILRLEKLAEDAKTQKLKNLKKTQHLAAIDLKREKTFSLLLTQKKTRLLQVEKILSHLEMASTNQQVSNPVSLHS